MGPVSYVIAILGCADGAASCQQVAVAPARYESASACEAASSHVLAGATDFDFPTLVARCQFTKRPAAARGIAPRKSGQFVKEG
jgi:hypothetical protein